VITYSQRFTRSALALLALATGSLISIGASADGDFGAFLPKSITSSTIPGNGDLNPYGVAFVPFGFPSGGTIAAGDVLVSNFNNIGNLQGTGTTIIKFTPTGDLAPGVPAGTNGNATTFFTSPLAGLTTALGVLRGGYVVVGNLPTTDGTSSTLSQGSLQVLDRNGLVVATLNDATFLDSPWDLTINDGGSKAQIFVSNVLSGTVSRLDVTVSGAGVTVTKMTQVAIGYTTGFDPAALVLGPTGLAYDRYTDKLFVASTDDNAVYSVSGAGKATSPVTKGTLVFADSRLRGPLALVFAPNGHLLTANGDAVNGDPLHPSEIVEFTRWGSFVRQTNVDASQGGAFGIATILGFEGSFNYAVIDDVANDLVVTSVHSGNND